MNKKEKTIEDIFQEIKNIKNQNGFLIILMITILIILLGLSSRV